jgi:hypothetical protein
MNQELTFHFNADPDTNTPSIIPKKGISVIFRPKLFKPHTKRHTMLGKSYLFPLQNMNLNATGIYKLDFKTVLKIRQNY